MEKQNILYALVDPRDGKDCYIGITTQLPQRRLGQHIRTINCTPISKLSKYLKDNELGFLSMRVLKTFGTLDELWKAEIETIKEYLENGVKLKNATSGGEVNYLTKESHAKATATKRQNGVFDYSKIGGFNSNLATIEERELDLIVEKILHGFSNEEILQMLNKDVKLSVIKAIRTGQNWKIEINGRLNFDIPSIPLYGVISSSREKLSIVKKISLGVPNKQIILDYRKLKQGDLTRIKERKLWVKVWEVYEKLSEEVKCGL
jgi:hypothetical protein